MVIKGDEWVLRCEGKEISRGSYRIDIYKLPQHEDCIHKDRSGKTTTYLGIYILEGKRLTCCYAEQSRGRPEEFENGPNKALVVWERAQP